MQRYASWARELCLGYREEVTDDTLRRLSSNSPGGVLCPNLERLHWSIAENTAAPPFLRLFLSPHLKEITLCTSSYTIDVPSSLPAAAAQIISLLPTSLEAMSVECFPGQDETLTDVISSFICQCGSSPRSFNTRIPLSEAAIQHVMQLPNLRSWTFTHEPPQIPLTPIFPSLEVLDFYIPKALPWLHILASHQKGTIENLEYISFPIGTIVDPTLLSSIITFRNLVALRVGSYCSNPEGCTFRLTDNDMENLAAALPRLGTLELGKPCGFNSCSNTVASLLSISIHCLDLTVLETHLNTRTIASDMQRLLDRGAGCDKAKCELSDLTTGYFPTELPEGDIETVMMGFKAIFPHLESVGCRGFRFKVTIHGAILLTWHILCAEYFYKA